MYLEEAIHLKRFFNKSPIKEQPSERVIFEMFYKRVYDTAYFITQDPNLAQDVVQETFFKAFRKMNTLEDGAKLGAWLGAIATTTSLDFLRKVKRWNDIAVEDVYIDEIVSKNQSVSSVENVVEQKFMKQWLRDHISKLTPPEYRQVIVLKYEYDLKDEEIARELKVNVGTVKSRLHRAKIKLRSILEQQQDEKDGGIL